jgi:branched-chain amino acid aminotransferase
MSITESSSIKIQKTTNSALKQLDFNNLAFGKAFADHMFIADYKNNQWSDSRIVPYGPFEISPSAAVLHYGQAIFEGMKAYKNPKGEVHLFRPIANIKRLNKSAERMCMQQVPEELFLQALTELVKLDKDFVPTAEGSSLYVRPFMIAMDEFIGVHPSDTYRFMIINSPSGAYYSAPVKVLVETKYTRAAEGGVGFAKVSGNYGRSLLPTKLAAEKGYQQLFWTDAKTHRFLEESGTMNLMVVIDDVLITPALGDTILAGITRDSVLTLARDWNMKVQERKLSVDEVLEAHQKGTLQDAFGTGTAATITHISHIGFEGKDYELPEIKGRVFSNKVKKELEDIHNGISQDKHGWMYKVC